MSAYKSIGPVEMTIIWLREHAQGRRREARRAEGRLGELIHPERPLGRGLGRLMAAHREAALVYERAAAQAEKEERE
jgi:hypothetical protein